MSEVPVTEKCPFPPDRFELMPLFLDHYLDEPLFFCPGGTQRAGSVETIICMKISTKHIIIDNTDTKDRRPQIKQAPNMLPTKSALAPDAVSNPRIVDVFIEKSIKIAFLEPALQGADGATTFGKELFQVIKDVIHNTLLKIHFRV